MRLILCMMVMGLGLTGCGGGGSSDGSSSSGSSSSGGSSSGGSSGGTVNPPTISSLSPNSMTAGGAAFTLTVNGSNFVASSVVDWGSGALKTSFVSASQLTAQVPATDLAASGTASITVVNPAADGGNSAAASFTIASVQTSSPALVQYNQYYTQGTNTEGNSTVSFNSVTKRGDAIWVAVTVSDFAGNHAISVTDSQNNVYTQLFPQENDGQPGYQTVAQFYAPNIVGDSATPDTITVNWTTDDYKGILVAEISGTTSAPLVGQAQNIQDGLGVGTNNVTAPAINVTAAQTPALLVALSMNTTGGVSDTGDGSGNPGPAAGTGMTLVEMVWDFGANLGTFATMPVTGAESVTPTFTNSSGTDSFVTVAAVFH